MLAIAKSPWLNNNDNNSDVVDLDVAAVDEEVAIVDTDIARR